MGSGLSFLLWECTSGLPQTIYQYTMKLDLDILKLWFANLTALLVSIAGVLTPFLEFIGVLSATTYTVWKLYLLAKEQKLKRNERDSAN